MVVTAPFVPYKLVIRDQSKSVQHRYNLQVVVTAPFVPYKLVIRDHNKEVLVSVQHRVNHQVVVTAPSVPYKLVIKEQNMKKFGSKELVVSSPADWLERTFVDEYQVQLVILYRFKYCRDALTTDFARYLDGRISG